MNGTDRSGRSGRPGSPPLPPDMDADEAALAARWRREADERPAPALDAEILAAARRAAPARNPWLRAAGAEWPFATAATVVLMVLTVLFVTDFGGELVGDAWLADQLERSAAPAPIQSGHADAAPDEDTASTPEQASGARSAADAGRQEAELLAAAAQSDLQRSSRERSRIEAMAAPRALAAPAATLEPGMASADMLSAEEEAATAQRRTAAIERVTFAAAGPTGTDGRDVLARLEEATRRWAHPDLLDADELRARDALLAAGPDAEPAMPADPAPLRRLEGLLRMQGDGPVLETGGQRWALRGRMPAPLVDGMPVSVRGMEVEPVVLEVLDMRLLAPASTER